MISGKMCEWFVRSVEYVLATPGNNSTSWKRVYVEEFGISRASQHGFGRKKDAFSFNSLCLPSNVAERGLKDKPCLGSFPQTSSPPLRKTTNYKRTPSSTWTKVQLHSSRLVSIKGQSLLGLWWHKHESDQFFLGKNISPCSGSSHVFVTLEMPLHV